MIVLDGSRGEGGGQILRTALSLSVLTGKPFRIERIRAGRDKPGLLRQHLTAVQSSAAISDAVVDGARLGSRELTFTPGKVSGGSFRFAIGTAGSTMLVIQTLLPALLMAAGPSEVIVEGGTHNVMAPSFDFFHRVFLRALSRMGATVNAEIERYGFYPAGGGRVRLQVTPNGPLQPIEIMERGALTGLTIRACVAALPRHVGEREVRALEQSFTDVPVQASVQVLDERVGPGNFVSVEIEAENAREMYCAHGEKGLRAEDLADRLSREVRRHLTAGVPVGEHLADQLLLPMAMAGGGSFLTVRPSEHTTTQAETIARFLESRTRFEQQADDVWKIEVTNATPLVPTPS